MNAHVTVSDFDRSARATSRTACKSSPRLIIDFYALSISVGDVRNLDPASKIPYARASAGILLLTAVVTGLVPLALGFNGAVLAFSFIISSVSVAGLVLVLALRLGKLGRNKRALGLYFDARARLVTVYINALFGPKRYFYETMDIDGIYIGRADLEVGGSATTAHLRLRDREGILLPDWLNHDDLVLLQTCFEDPGYLREYLDAHVDRSA